jgi:hypothetical protein
VIYDNRYIVWALDKTQTQASLLGTDMLTDQESVGQEELKAWIVYQTAFAYGRHNCG